MITSASTGLRAMRDWNEDCGGARWKSFAARYSVPRELAVGWVYGKQDARRAGRAMNVLSRRPQPV